MKHAAYRLFFIKKLFGIRFLNIISTPTFCCAGIILKMAEKKENLENFQCMNNAITEGVQTNLKNEQPNFIQ